MFNIYDRVGIDFEYPFQKTLLIINKITETRCA